jgi:signal transduction histidine kinase
VAESLRRVFGTIRFRTTLAAVVTVGIAFLIAGFALVWLMRSTLIDEVRAAAQLRAQDVAASLARGETPPTQSVGDDEQLVQIVNGGESSLAPGESRVIRPAGADEDYVAVAVAAPPSSGATAVIVARSVGDVTDATSVLTRFLAIGLPALLLLVGFISWEVTGRALMPVERMRTEVDDISTADLNRRVSGSAGHDEVARLAETMNRMLSRLEDSQLRQQRFVADASHELRSPVTSIRHHAEVALAHPEQSSLDDLAETVLAEDLRLQHLVEDLLLLARVDEHTLELRLRPVDVDDIVFDEARRLRSTTTAHIDTTAVTAARAQGDDKALRQLLRNLGDNAARHATSRVAFALSETDGSVLLQVDDDGPGIPEEDRERVLERFVRLDDARSRDVGGTGLGLAIATELVHVHGGELTIAASSLGGARVNVQLRSASTQ